MEEEAAPHVFVAHTDLTKLACDLVLVPTDVNRYVTERFQYLGQPSRASLPSGWSDSGVRVTAAVPESSGLGRLVRWVNTGSVPGRDPVDWLLAGVRQGLDAAGESLRGRQPQRDRSRSLVGLPLLGTGAGGFGAVRGEVLEGILRECAEAARRHKYDVVIACSHRSDYAALQHQRLKSGAAPPALQDSLMHEARRLGELAGNGDLVLFLGAGISQSAACRRGLA